MRDLQMLAVSFWILAIHVILHSSWLHLLYFMDGKPMDCCQGCPHRHTPYPTLLQEDSLKLSREQSDVSTKTPGQPLVGTKFSRSIISVFHGSYLSLNVITCCNITSTSTVSLTANNQVFYDQVHTTGIDIRHPPHACAALTLGKEWVGRAE